MQNTKHHYVALLCGGIAVSGALAILLQDAIFTGTWKLEHGLIPALMAVQILAAHLFGQAIRDKRVVSGVGFLIVAVIGTWGVLYTSVGKQSRVAAEAEAGTAYRAEERAKLEKTLALNTEMLEGARVALAKECGTGKGSKCEGKSATVQVYEDAVAGVEAKLAKLGPEAPASSRATKMAELIAGFTGATQAHVEHMLLLVEPFTFATIFELGALVSFGFAFGGHRKPSGDLEVQKPALPAFLPILTEQEKVTEWVQGFEDQHGREPTFSEVRKAFPAMSKASVSRRRHEALSA